MSLVNPLRFLKKARDRGVAITAFNIYNMETIQAVIEGAAEERSPVIIQVTPRTLKYAGISYVTAMIKAAALEYDIPIAMHLDHCSSYEVFVKCIKYGFTSVMVDGSELPYNENVALAKEVVKFAHALDVAVEAELGHISRTENDFLIKNKGEAKMTDPSVAKNFIEDTGVDTLAVAIGTAHGVYRGEPKLDFERLALIRKTVDVPLVLHGASGLDDESIVRLIKEGVSKINIATDLKISMVAAIRAYFTNNPKEYDLRKYMEAGRKVAKEDVKKKIRLCGANELGNFRGYNCE